MIDIKARIYFNQYFNKKYHGKLFPSNRFSLFKNKNLIMKNDEKKN